MHWTSIQHHASPCNQAKRSADSITALTTRESDRMDHRHIS